MDEKNELKGVDAFVVTGPPERPPEERRRTEAFGPNDEALRWRRALPERNP